MPSVSKLAIGQRIEVRSGAGWLPTRLEDFSGERLVLAWPTDRERRLLPVKVGDRIDIAATAEDALYSAPATVDYARHEGLPLLTVRVTGGWQRQQRREAVRVPVAIRPRIAARVIDGQSQPLRAGISNLSATGVQLRSQDELRSGDVVDLAFSVRDIDEELQLLARVRRVQLKEQGTLKYWEAGCKFEDLPQRLSQKLMQFIFAQQRTMARRKAS